MIFWLGFSVGMICGFLCLLVMVKLAFRNMNLQRELRRRPFDPLLEDAITNNRTISFTLNPKDE